MQGQANPPPLKDAVLACIGENEGLSSAKEIPLNVIGVSVCPTQSYVDLVGGTSAPHGKSRQSLPRLVSYLKHNWIYRDKLPSLAQRGTNPRTTREQTRT